MEKAGQAEERKKSAIARGERVRQIRIASGLKQQEVADLSKKYNGVFSRAHYSMMENGARDLTIEAVAVLVLHLHASIYYILSGEGAMFTQAPAKMRALPSSSLASRIEANNEEIESMISAVKITRRKIALEKEARKAEAEKQQPLQDKD